MELDFIGIDPETGREGSPTEWVDRESREIVIQGWTAGADLLDVISRIAWAPDHTPGIPEGEAVVRVPARMARILREACDVAERAGL
ncbi:hypothetical protein K353_05182 [Kitasatospora sp. SolWspMP-SS2h]|uniref:hypothetical protein n=1 Tax=Kitasatospora sp. SolWspMP-SS2h TaxID=1305729 RepID=UPI000DB90FA5|nr:hypothetical protein [Kitasatospora sp. SolWspMP-SS2h]RAJ35315.1 hypothetical protein K353_05182 [Kitasatospora sp. SolWspMP-SS2h]